MTTNVITASPQRIENIINIPVFVKSVPTIYPWINPITSTIYIRVWIILQGLIFFLNSTASKAIYRIIIAGLPAFAQKPYQESKTGLKTDALMVSIEYEIGWIVIFHYSDI